MAQAVVGVGEAGDVGVDHRGSSIHSVDFVARGVLVGIDDGDEVAGSVPSGDIRR